MQKKGIFITTLLFLTMLFVCCGSGDKALNKKLREMAADLNNSAPVMLDQNTRFDGASVTAGNVFRYRYTVLNTDNPDSLLNSALQTMQEDMKSAFAVNPDLRIFKENKVTIEYVYSDENDRTIRSVTITPEDYL